MRDKVVKGESNKAWGKPLSSLKTKDGSEPPAKLAYRRVAKLFDTAEELRAANSWPEDAQIVKYKNRDIVAKTRSAALAAQVEAAGLIQPTMENDVLMQLQNATKTYYARLVGQMSFEDRANEENLAAAMETARAKASEFLGEEWPDEDEDEE